MVESKFSQAGFDATYDKKESIKYGVVLGIISLVFGILISNIILLADSFLVSTIISKTLNEGVYIVFSLIFAYQLRKKNGGYWNFSIALKSIFLMLLISTLIAVIGTEIYVNFVNTTIQVESLQHTMNLAIESMEAERKPDELIDARIIGFEKAIEELQNKTIMGMLRGLVIAILLQFIFSLVLAAITRNEKLSQGQPDLK